MNITRRSIHRNAPTFTLALGAALVWALLLGLTALPLAAVSYQDEEPESTTAASEEEPESYNNTIRWATASEVDNFGFDVFRSENEEGPFDRLNSEVIEGAGTTDEPQRYQWVDDTIDPRKIYYYYVESISMSGVREQFTPVGRAKAKIPSEEEEEAAEAEEASSESSAAEGDGR